MKIVFTAITVLALLTNTAFSQVTNDTQRKTPFSTCLAVAQNIMRIMPASASLTFAQTNQDYSVDITYVGHSTFRLVTPEDIVIATDFTGEAGRGFVPNVVTMNRAHVTHFTSNPSPQIKHVLRGWGENGEPARHFLEVGETIIRNVTTDINSNFSGYYPNGNSIFIFETAGLCIGHLGHLHHLLTNDHYAEIGRIDVLMVPVDGGYTMNLDDMGKVVERLRSRVILPMHWFGGYSLSQFISKMEAKFPVSMKDSSSIEVSLRNLPKEPTIIVLQPETTLGMSFE